MSKKKIISDEKIFVGDFFMAENNFGDAKEILENLKNFPKLADFVKNADISIKSRSLNKRIWLKFFPAHEYKSTKK